MESSNANNPRLHRIQWYICEMTIINQPYFVTTIVFNVKDKVYTDHGSSCLHLVHWSWYGACVNEVLKSLIC